MCKHGDKCLIFNNFLVAKASSISIYFSCYIRTMYYITPVHEVKTSVSFFVLFCCFFFVVFFWPVNIFYLCFISFIVQFLKRIEIYFFKEKRSSIVGNIFSIVFSRIKIIKQQQNLNKTSEKENKNFQYFLLPCIH